MNNLRIGTFRYETTSELFNHKPLMVDGVGSAEMSTAPTLPGVFERFLDGETDVSEFGLTFLLRALDAGEPFMAIPVFPARVFRHSCVFVNAHAGIHSPADLKGRTIGEFGVYGQDSGVWIKGVLMDEYGFRPEENRWVIGGLEQPSAPFGFTTHLRPEGVDIVTDTEHSLSDLLETGEIDALFTANVPQPFLDGSPNVTRLFPDYEAVERDWYARTGIFPMMHTLAVRRDLLEAHPGLARAVYETFLGAKEAGAERYRQARRWFEMPASMLPWANSLYERNDGLFGADWWPYGLEANRKALETFLRYHREQGLSATDWTVDEIFAPID